MVFVEVWNNLYILISVLLLKKELAQYMLELTPPLTLPTLGAALPIFQALFPYDVYMDITDRQQFLYVCQAKSFTLSVKAGDPIPQGSMAEEMFRTGKPTFARATRETTLFGFPYIARGIPIFENGEVVATMSLAMNVDDMERMEELSQRLAEYLEQISNRTKELSVGAEELATTASAMIKQGESTQKESHQMASSLEEVQKLAQQSNVLSINTSIEAARLGNAGRSFLVIAQYMQDLANSSLESSKTINKGLELFQENLEATLESLNAINSTVQKQALDIASLAKSSQEIEVLSHDLANISLFYFGNK